jgi:hypothetical protein
VAVDFCFFYTTEAQVIKSITMEALEKHLLEKQWLCTWKELFSNGVVRHDLISMAIGEVVDLDMVPGKSGNVVKLRALAREEGVLEKFQEDISSVVDPFNIHCAKIGFVKREESSRSNETEGSSPFTAAMRRSSR